jgi:hypothetical protein
LETFHKFAWYIKEILCESLQPLDEDANIAPLNQYVISTEKDKVAEKMATRHFPHFIHKFMKLFMNQAYD